MFIFKKCKISNIQCIFFYSLLFFTVARNVVMNSTCPRHHEDSELRAVTESVHRIFQCLRGIIKNDHSGTPEGAIIQTLIRIANEGNIQDELLWARREATNIHNL